MTPSTLVEVLDSSWIPAGGGHRVFTSLEGENPGGSIKDHLVLGAIAKWRLQGELRSGRILAEASAGSTGRSLAYYARQAGCQCAILASRSLPAPSLRQLEEDLHRLGAELRIEPAEEILVRLHSYCARENALCLNQMGDPGKRDHYAALGRQVLGSLGPVDLLIGAVGTGHSLLGIAKEMPETRVLTAEPLDGNVPGVRNIEQQRFGPADPVQPGDFDDRILVPGADHPAPVAFRSSHGEIQATASFGLVLRAASTILRRGPSQRVFLIGAANYRKGIGR